MSTSNAEGLLEVVKFEANYGYSFGIRRKDSATYMAAGLTADDGRRLAACWNALEDMGTDSIESISLAGGTVNKVLLKALRDGNRFAEALSLLTELIEEFDRIDTISGERIMAIRAFLNGGAK